MNNFFLVMCFSHVSRKSVITAEICLTPSCSVCVLPIQPFSACRSHYYFTPRYIPIISNVWLYFHYYYYHNQKMVHEIDDPADIFRSKLSPFFSQLWLKCPQLKRVTIDTVVSYQNESFSSK